MSPGERGGRSLAPGQVGGVACSIPSPPALRTRARTGGPGEEDASAESLNAVPGAGGVPEGVEAVASPLVPGGDRGDGHPSRFNRLPGRERPLARLEDLVVVRLAASGIDDERTRPQA